jgi:hypothetical protein
MRYIWSASMSVVLSALIVAGSACAGSRLIDPGPGKRVEATLTQDAYLSGGLVDITIKNLSDVPLQYPLGFCKIELEREENSAWLTVLIPDGCPLALAFLGPGQAVGQAYRLPTGIPSGTYRLSMPMPVPKSATAPEPRLTTPSFRVGSTAF